MAYANDNFASAIPLSGASGSYPAFHYGGDDGLATAEPNEWIGRAGTTLWWSWVCPSDGHFAFTTEGSPSDQYGPYQLDTVLQIFDVADPTAQSIAYNDDNPDGQGYNSLADFTGVAGQTYYVQLDFYGTNEQGTVNLSWGPYVVLDPYYVALFVDHQNGALGDDFVMDGSSSVGVATYYYEVQDYTTNAVLGRSPEGTGTPTTWTYHDTSASFRQAWAYLFTTAPDGRTRNSPALLTIGTPPPLGDTTLTAVVDPSDGHAVNLSYVTPDGAPYRLDLERKYNNGSWVYHRNLDVGPGPHQVTDSTPDLGNYSYRLHGYTGSEDRVCSNEATVKVLATGKPAVALVVTEYGGGVRWDGENFVPIQGVTYYPELATYSATEKLWLWAGGDYFATSDDGGVNWSPLTFPTYVYPNNGPTYVAVANNGSTFLMQERDDPYIAVSDDRCQTWERIQIADPLWQYGSPTSYYYIFDGGGVQWTGKRFSTIYMHTADYENMTVNKCFTSTDGRTWTELPYPDAGGTYGGFFQQWYGSDAAVIAGDVIVRPVQRMRFPNNRYYNQTVYDEGLIFEGPTSVRYQVWTYGGGTPVNTISTAQGLFVFTRQEYDYRTHNPVVVHTWLSTDGGATFSKVTPAFEPYTFGTADDPWPPQALDIESAIIYDGTKYTYALAHRNHWLPPATVATVDQQTYTQVTHIDYPWPAPNGIRVMQIIHDQQFKNPYDITSFAQVVRNDPVAGGWQSILEVYENSYPASLNFVAPANVVMNVYQLTPRPDDYGLSNGNGNDTFPYEYSGTPASSTVHFTADDPYRQRALVFSMADSADYTVTGGRSLTPLVGGQQAKAYTFERPNYDTALDFSASSGSAVVVGWQTSSYIRQSTLLLRSEDLTTWSAIGEYNQRVYATSLALGPPAEVPVVDPPADPFIPTVVSGGDLKRVRFIRQR